MNFWDVHRTSVVQIHLCDSIDNYRYDRRTNALSYSAHLIPSDPLTIPWYWRWRVQADFFLTLLSSAGWWGRRCSLCDWPASLPRWSTPPPIAGGAGDAWRTSPVLVGPAAFSPSLLQLVKASITPRRSRTSSFPSHYSPFAPFA